MKKEKASTEGRLWLIKMKLKGIAFLIQDRNSSAPIPLDVDDCYYGVGELLNEIADQVGAILQELTDRKMTKNGNPKS
jgi:hypothetical protein